MIIATSGKINSGKDLVGNIIQYLTTPKGDNNFTLQDYITDKSSYLYAGNNWEIKKFSGKLKDIVCLLIGCTRGQLEDRDFKEKELGEEWWVIKQTADNIIIPYFDLKTRILNGEFNIDGHHTLIKPTPRLLLQNIGTDLFRTQLHPSVWVNSLMSDYKIQKDRTCLSCNYSFNFSEVSDNKYYKCPKCGERNDAAVLIYESNWIITDTRFYNEAEAVKNKGGILIRINRPCRECGGLGHHKMDCGIGRLEHSSETGLDDYKDFDYTIVNDGTIEDLIDIVKEILVKENII